MFFPLKLFNASTANGLCSWEEILGNYKAQKAPKFRPYSKSNFASLPFAIKLKTFTMLSPIK